MMPAGSLPGSMLFYNDNFINLMSVMRAAIAKYAPLDMRDFHSLEELRRSLYAFVQQYNQFPHSSLRGLSPQDRFFSEPEQIRRLSEEDIRQNFLRKRNPKL